MNRTSEAGLAEKVIVIHERLCRTYGCPVSYFHSFDPLSEMISALLSHRTRNADSGKAFKSLRKRYVNWEALRDAPVDEIMSEISMVTWPEAKAPRLKQVLSEITNRRDGRLELDFLEHLDSKSGREWLQSLTGVGPKTSAAVMSFSNLRKKALPVDSHHHRVAQRLGLISEKVAVGPSHDILLALLPEEWTAQQLYDNHEVMMFHGQRCCFFQSPACARCPLLDLCPTGQTRTKPRLRGPAEKSTNPIP